MGKVIAICTGEKRGTQKKALVPLSSGKIVRLGKKFAPEIGIAKLVCFSTIKLKFSAEWADFCGRPNGGTPCIMPL